MEIPNVACVMRASQPGACLLNVLKKSHWCQDMALHATFISFIYVYISIFYFVCERNLHCYYTEGAGRVAIQWLHRETQHCGSFWRAWN